MSDSISNVIFLIPLFFVLQNTAFSLTSTVSSLQARGAIYRLDGYIKTVFKQAESEHSLYQNHTTSLFYSWSPEP